MANSGPNKNNSQFFITYGEFEHLNEKNTIFGRVLLEKSEETLNKIEKEPVGKANRPLNKI